ncbi:MAG: PQQ-binding-like beta-propeller repeat protein [Bacteroidota bacterium]
MKKFVSILSISFLFFSCKDDSNPIKTEPPNPYAQKEIDWPSLQKAPWPMYRHDPQLTGRSQYVGPTKGIIVDTLKYKRYLPASVSIDANDNIYIPFSSGESDIYCYSLKFDTLKWKLKLPTNTLKIPTTPTITKNNSILYTSTRLYSISDSGKLQWQVQSQKEVAGGLNVQIDKSGNIYYIEQAGTTATATLYCVSPTGQLQWSFADERLLYGICSPAFSPDGNTLYLQAGTNTTTLIAYDISSKSIKWTFEGLPLFSTPIVDNQGNIYFQKNTVTTSLDTFYCLTKDGKVRWKYIFPKKDQQAFQYLYEPTIDYDGNVYILSTKDTLVSLTNDGLVRWKLPLTAYGGCYYSIVCDRNNNIYFVTGNHFLLSVSKAGSINWSIQFNHGFDVYPSLAITEGKLFLVTSYNGLIYIVE